MAKLRLLGTGKVAIVDDKDLKKVQGRKWRYDGKRVKGSSVDPKTGKRGTVFMANLILGKTGIVTFVNGNVLDCREANLCIKAAKKKAPAKPKAPAKKTTTKK